MGDRRPQRRSLDWLAGAGDTLSALDEPACVQTATASAEIHFLSHCKPSNVFQLNSLFSYLCITDVLAHLHQGLIPNLHTRGPPARSFETRSNDIIVHSLIQHMSLHLFKESRGPVII